MANNPLIRFFTKHHNWTIFIISLLIFLLFSSAHLASLRYLLVFVALMIGVIHLILRKRTPANISSQLKLKQSLILILIIMTSSATSSVLKTLLIPTKVNQSASTHPKKITKKFVNRDNSSDSSSMNVSKNSTTTSSTDTTSVVNTSPASASSNTTNSIATNDATSTDTAPQQTTTTATSTSSSVQDMNDYVTTDSGGVIGDVNSHIYHLPSQKKYHIKPENVIRFATEAEAQAAGYHRSKR